MSLCQGLNKRSSTYVMNEQLTKRFLPLLVDLENFATLASPIVTQTHQKPCLTSINYLTIMRIRIYLVELEDNQKSRNYMLHRFIGSPHRSYGKNISQC